MPPEAMTATVELAWDEPPPLLIEPVRDADALEAGRAEWEDLAAHSVEPNPFYEPWMLLPALRTLARDKDLVLVRVYLPAENGRRMVGFFPLERIRHYRGLPLTVLRLLQHPHCYLCTPLVRKGYERECMEAFFRWTRRRARCAFLELGDISGEGPFHDALREHLGRHRNLHVSHRYTRALFRPRCDAGTYLKAALPGRKGKELRRLARRLAERGRVETRALAAPQDAEPWIQSFLSLERRGWKGRAGTALASSLAGREFFEAIARDAWRRGRLSMLGLYLDGNAIALSCKLRAGDGVFAFKIAFDEAYEEYSPGTLLELEHIVRLHNDAGVAWMDSCAAPDHFMANRLWVDRRILETMRIAAGGPGDIVLALLPLLRWARRRLRWRPRTGTPTGTA